MIRIFSIVVLVCSSAVALAASDRVDGGETQAVHSQCQRKCQNAAKRFYRECRQNGGAEEACQAAAREWFANCVKENCLSVPPCEVRCQNEAVHIYRACVESGEVEEVCATRARGALIQCLTEHCNIPDNCEKRCEYLGHQFARLCVAEGGTQEECAAKAREFVQRCVQEHCPACGGILGIECPDGEFCMFTPGECNVADNQGICVPMPQACPLFYQPVCGCDGMTYGNVCEAAAAGVSIDHPGPCLDVCGGIMGEPCPEGQFCQFRPGRCDVADDQGVCRPVPLGCPDVWMPVCGCDGKTYGNACDAAAAQVSIDHEGECKE